MDPVQTFCDSVSSKSDGWDIPKDIAVMVVTLTTCRDCAIPLTADDNYGRCKVCLQARNVAFVNSLIYKTIHLPLVSLCACDGCPSKPFDDKPLLFLSCMVGVHHPKVTDVSASFCGSPKMTVNLCNNEPAHIEGLLVTLKKEFTMGRVALKTEPADQMERALMEEFAVELELLSRPIEGFVPPPPPPPPPRNAVRIKDLGFI